MFNLNILHNHAHDSRLLVYKTTNLDFLNMSTSKKKKKTKKDKDCSSCKKAKEMTTKYNDTLTEPWIKEKKRKKK